MKKNIVKINEAQLKKIVAESVKKVLKEDESYVRNIDGSYSELDSNVFKGQFKEAIEKLEQKIKEAFYECQKYQGDFPSDAVRRAKDDDNIDLSEEWRWIDSNLRDCLEHIKSLKHYSNF